MKIRHPLLLKVLSFAVACLVRLWIGTVRYRYRPLGANYDPNQRHFRGRYIYAFWHENMLMPVYQYGGHDIYVLISKHADGQLIADASYYLGFKTVRGSTTRDGVEAVRAMVLHGVNSQLAVTPDGPRGPRRQVQMGLIFLAAKTGLPIVPIGIAFHRAWRLKSWDRFALPYPGSRVSCVTTEAIAVPEKIDKKEMELYRQKVQDAIDRATEAAERLRLELRLDRKEGLVMSSPSVTTTIDTQEPIDALPYMALWVRGGLMCIAAFLIVIFSIAIYLDPYIRDESGQIVAARRSATHTTMGLPPCTFKETTGIPCPSCGMTSSFALLIRGDLWHSVQANFAGTMLGTFCLFLIPWSLASIWKQKLLFVRSFESVFTIFIATFMAVMMLRWAVVAGLLYFFKIEVPM